MPSKIKRDDRVRIENGRQFDGWYGRVSSVKTNSKGAILQVTVKVDGDHLYSWHFKPSELRVIE